MKKLKVKPVIEESSDLIKIYSNQSLTEVKILGLIDNAKKLERGKGIDKLRGIVVDYNKIAHSTRPGKASYKISSTGETAYQRAIFLSGKTKLNSLGEIIWNDLELPVVFNKNSKRRCLDLIGTLNNKTLVLCELKFASRKSYSNSPIYAAIELLIYYYLIQDNCHELDNKKVFHTNKEVKSFKWGDLNHNSTFIVGANEKYWNYWKQRYEKCKDEIESWLKSLPTSIHFFSSKDFDFEEQKKTEGGKTYEPRFADKTEWKEVDL